jgi:thiamine-monophosphate kinase
MSEERTELGDLGEFGLIRKLTSDFSLKNPGSLVGVGDDAAVISVDENRVQLVSTAGRRSTL